MKQNQVINKAQQGEELTVEEIKVYQEVVKPVKQVYGKYGTLKKKFLEKNGIEWMIADLPTYLHGIDKQAEEMYIVLQSSDNKIYKHFLCFLLFLVLMRYRYHHSYDYTPNT